MRDPGYEFASPYYVFLHYQARPQCPLCCVFDAMCVLSRHPQLLFPYDYVPLNVSNASEHTIDTTGIDEVYDSVMNPNNKKRFCVINFTVPMELHKYRKNFPKAHIVFKYSTFHTADE